MYKVKNLRDTFLNFFEERDHRIIPSSSLVPKDDPTLLFTTAGMVQFKPMFAGTVDLEYTRAATVQKCLRTSDLENVGKTKRHCTFFEMLGNFSFGDYFKKEAIRYAWDYSTDIIKFPKDNIWISIYIDDDEAFDLWHKDIGIPDTRIVRLGKADNFWGPAGDTGACGPCTELYLDRGTEFGCSSSTCKPGCDCERFMEYWNLVFNQYYQDESGKQTPLPKTGIDTGLGLERLATLVQDVDSIYETDELNTLVSFICKETGAKYIDEFKTPINILVEHTRALTFSISDGVYPSNEGRGYVLRRLLRRALRFGRQIGIVEPLIYRLVDPIVDIMGSYYPEIVNSSKNVKNILEGEEKRFLETLETGMDRLNEILESMSKSNEQIINGKDAFILYDTYGFPLEMTEEIASEKGLSVDVHGFETEMEKQRERGKKSWKSTDSARDKLQEEIAKQAGETGFKGYDENIIETNILIISNETEIVQKIKKNEKANLITHETTFYAEAGGQIGDTGRIISSDGSVFRVYDTKRFNKTVIHSGEVLEGEFAIGNIVNTEIDVLRRNLIKANHTATHLVQAALRSVIGDHLHQSGSLVEPERLRFDFTHYNALSFEELTEVERIVNEKIWLALPVETRIMDIDKATSMGAIAVFDEKYDDVVRVVRVPDFSLELCGGTHVDNTGKIGVFKILKEASPGAGIRRIEAITLKGIYDRYIRQDKILADISDELKIPEAGIVKKIRDLTEKLNSMDKKFENMKKQDIESNIDSMISNAVDIKGIKVIVKEFRDVDVDELRKISDLIRSKERDSLICFGSINQGKVLLLFAATKSAVEKGVDCGAMIKSVSKTVGGGGGGRKDMAQAGGKKPEALPQAMKQVLETANSMII